MLQYFTDAISVTDNNFMNNQVLTTNDNLGDQGSKEYSNSYSLITNSYETKFGAAKHFISNICDCEDNDNPKYRNIKDQFVGNYYKL